MIRFAGYRNGTYDLADERKVKRQRGMRKYNKAHTATINRIARRFGVDAQVGNGSELLTPLGLIGVETGATVARRIRSLKKHVGAAYIAVTNREALADALRAAEGSCIGVMDPQGNIVKRAGPHNGAGRNDAGINGNTPVLRDANRSRSP
jgi:hypothetical protein